MQQNPSERMRCKFNTAMDMCLFGYNRMIMNYGYEHTIISSYIIYIGKATANLQSKYRKHVLSIAYKINELRYFEGQNSEF